MKAFNLILPLIIFGLSLLFTACNYFNQGNPDRNIKANIDFKSDSILNVVKDSSVTSSSTTPSITTTP